MYPTARARAVLAAVAATLPLAACTSAGRLAEYDFRDRTVAVVATVPPRPHVDTGDDVDLTGLTAPQALLKVGTGIYKEVQAGKLRARMDSAGGLGRIWSEVSAGTVAFQDRLRKVLAPSSWKAPDSM